MPAINSRLMKGSRVFNRCQQLKLIEHVTRENVLMSLQGIRDHKAHGCDGFNILFFRIDWQSTEEEVTDVVLGFFAIGIMCKAINCTTVTLIPKITHPGRVSEYRLVFYCILLYKIIDKVLTNRMQQVIDDLVDKNQCLFVLDRLINDNIILNSELVKGYEKGEFLQDVCSKSI